MSAGSAPLTTAGTLTQTFYMRFLSDRLLQRSPHLFNDIKSGDFFAAKIDYFRQAIESWNISRDPAQMESSLRTYSYNTPKLLLDQKQMLPIEESEEKINNYQRNMNFVYGKRLKLKFEIPFAGSDELFLVCPNRYTSSPPIAELNDNSIVITVYTEDLTQEAAILNNLNQEIFKINQYLDWLREEVDTYNQQIRNLFLGILATKNETTQMQQRLAQSLGIRTKNPQTNNESPALIVSSKRRNKEIPKSNNGPSKNSVRRLIEAILISDSDLEAFCIDHFPDVIRRFANNMDKVMKINLLLQHSSPAQITAKLRKYHPDEYERLAHMIKDDE